jgi:hypothetical protein
LLKHVLSWYVMASTSAPADALAKALRMTQELELEVISLTPSRASLAKLQTALARLTLRMERGGMFQVVDQTGSLQGFLWPPGPNDAEAERQGYSEAIKWLQKHVCPPGVQAVLVSNKSWLQWWVPKHALVTHHLAHCACHLFHRVKWSPCLPPACACAPLCERARALSVQALMVITYAVVTCVPIKT